MRRSMPMTHADIDMGGVRMIVGKSGSESPLMNIIEHIDADSGT